MDSVEVFDGSRKAQALGLVLVVQLGFRKDLRSFSLLLGGFIFLGVMLLAGYVFESSSGVRLPTSRVAADVALWCWIGLLAYYLIAAFSLLIQSLWLLVTIPIQVMMGVIVSMVVGCATGNGCV